MTDRPPTPASPQSVSGLDGDAMTPAQLDILEDAVELLSAPDGETDHDVATGTMKAVESDAVLRSRLEDYREVLTLTRQAWPDVEPDPHVLDDVMAEARRAASQHESPASVGWWERWRSYVVPAAALAATAGLVLWIARPGGNEATLDGAVAIANGENGENGENGADKPKAQGPSPAAAAEAEADSQASGPNSPDDYEFKDAVAEPEEQVTSPAQPGRAKGDASSGGAPPKNKAATKPAPPNAVPHEAMPEPEPAPTDKDERYQLLEQADGKRQRGSCQAAMEIYQRLMDGGHGHSRARAGYGLCLEQQGQPDEAEAYYDEDQRAFIDTERDDMRDVQRTKQKKSRAKPSKKQSLEALPDASD